MGTPVMAATAEVVPVSTRIRVVLQTRTLAPPLAAKVAGATLRGWVVEAWAFAGVAPPAQQAGKRALEDQGKAARAQGTPNTAASTAVAVALTHTTRAIEAGHWHGKTQSL